MNRTVAVFVVMTMMPSLLAQQHPPPSAQRQTNPDKFAILVSGAKDSEPVVQSLTKLINGSKPFVVAQTKDDSKASVVIQCIEREKKDQPYVCMYLSSYLGATFSTMLGAGLRIGATADDMALELFNDILSDILERWNDTDQQHLKAELETCLFLSTSSCDVPEPLQKSLGVKTITFREYLLKKKQ